jgi:hypothetical protein
VDELASTTSIHIERIGYCEYPPSPLCVHQP